MIKKHLKGLMSIGEMISMVMIAIIFGATIGIVADSTIGINNSGIIGGSNVTGATGVIIDLVPLFLAIAVILGFVSKMRGEG